MIEQGAQGMLLYAWTGCQQTRLSHLNPEEIDVRYPCCPAGSPFFQGKRSSPPYCIAVLLETDETNGTLSLLHGLH